MRATLNIPDTLISDLVLETGEKNKTRLIKTALEEMLRAIRRRKLMDMGGTLELNMTGDDLLAEREMDMI